MKEAGRYKITLFVSTIVMLNVLTSCSMLKKIEYRDLVVDHYNTVTVHDTLREHITDSTYHLIKIINDTVYDTKYIERTRWRDRIVQKHDTCWRDSVDIQHKETVKEVIKIPKYYHFAFVLSLLIITFAIIKRIK